MSRESIAVAIHTFRKPALFRALLQNIQWAGWPDVPIYVFEDPSPYGDREAVTHAYEVICRAWNVPFHSAPYWGHMTGISNYAMRMTEEQWIIWVPDDVLFTRGGLWYEVGGVRTYGQDFIGGFQVSYWNSHDLIEKGWIPSKYVLKDGTYIPDNIPRNPHWDADGLPRCYANFNGAGFVINRKLWKAMGGYDERTSRLDEYAGFKAWQLGFPILTLPGPPRIHYFGGSADLSPSNPSDLQGYQEALGMSIDEAVTLMRAQMAKIPATAPDGSINDVLDFFHKGGILA